MGCRGGGAGTSSGRRCQGSSGVGGADNDTTSSCCSTEGNTMHLYSSVF